MAGRYLTPMERENEASFRVVEIFVVSKKTETTGKSVNRFLLVDNRRETLEVVQRDMQDFVRNAVMVNRIMAGDGAEPRNKVW